VAAVRRILRISGEFVVGSCSGAGRAGTWPGVGSDLAGTGSRLGRDLALPKCQTANGKNRQKLPLSFASLCSERLTETAAEPYIGPLGCAAASARWRVREAPHCLHGDRAYGHACGHVRVTASNAGVCCLTSESEERETWTAESLRAAFRAGASLRENGQDETSAVDVLGQYPVARVTFTRVAGDGPRQTL
jgi:hypothetical protein